MEFGATGEKEINESHFGHTENGIYVYSFLSKSVLEVFNATDLNREQ